MKAKLALSLSLPLLALHHQGKARPLSPELSEGRLLGVGPGGEP